MSLPAGWKSPSLPSSLPARATRHWFAKSSSQILERKRSTLLQEDYRLPGQRPLWETVGLTGCCNACHPFTLPALCSLLSSVNSLNELPGFFWPRPISSSWTGKCLLNSWHCNCYGKSLLLITEKPWTTKLLSCFCTPSESTSLASAMMLMDNCSGRRQPQEKLTPEQLEMPCCIYHVTLPSAETQGYNSNQEEG